MPGLFALGQHAALLAARQQLHADDVMVAFLDDLYCITTRERARHVYDVLTTAVREHAGVHAHQGKTLAFSMAGGPPPPGIAELDTPEHRVWVSDLEPRQRGLVILGVPVGDAAFREAALSEDPAGRPTHLGERLRAESSFLQKLPAVQDPQSVWLLLRLCAEPRANHVLRTVPPSLAHGFAAGHNHCLWEALCSFLTHTASEPSREVRVLANAPSRFGGLGLRCAVRTAPAAYWAGWADALLVLRERVPTIATAIVQALKAGGGPSQTLREATEAAALLGEEGFAVPTWRELLDGRRPPSPGEGEQGQAEPGEWEHGWQFWAADVTRGSVSPWNASGRTSMPGGARVCAPRWAQGQPRG